MLQGTGFTRAQDDSYTVLDYIQSRDALKELNRNNYILDTYSSHGDIINRFSRSFDDSFEALWKYYSKRIVALDLDATSGITTLQVRAFTAEDAAKINEMLLEMGERLINRMNQRAATDSVKFAQTQVDIAQAKAKNAAAALAAYRNKYVVFDPEKQSALQLDQVSKLRSQLLDAQTQLGQLQLLSPKNPQIPALKNSISTITQQIQTATVGVTGGKNSLSEKAADYARVQLDAQFADKQLASTMAALENARADANRKQLYLERLVQPEAPDKAIEPKRIRGILTTLVIGMVVWATLSLLFASVREHRD